MVNKSIHEDNPGDDTSFINNNMARNQGQHGA